MIRKQFPSKDEVAQTMTQAAALQSQVDSEQTNARVQGDNIESTARILGDSSLGLIVSHNAELDAIESSTRQQNDSAEITARQNADNLESTARSQADANFSAALNLNATADAQEKTERKSADAITATKLDTLPKGVSFGSAAIPTLSLLAVQTIVVVFNKPQLSTNYKITIDIFGIGLGSIKVSPVLQSDKFLDKVNVTITATAAITVTTGIIEIMIVSKDY